VSEKSSSVVSRLRLAAGCWPRAASTASAVAAMVPPTQKPNTFAFGWPLISRVTSIARIAPFST
jgi:hypothetical protein